MNELAFNRWLLHTSRDWDDIKDILTKTYIPIIDQDHKQLARYALDLNLILEKIQRKEISLKVLKEEKKTIKQFLEYTKEHFEREERIINYFMLGNYEEQVEDHKKTLQQITDVANNLEKGKIIFTQDQKMELLEKVIEHTNGLDSETMKIEAFSFIFEKMKDIKQLKLFINLTGFPFVDEIVIGFFKETLEILNNESEKDYAKSIESLSVSMIDEINKFMVDNNFSLTPINTKHGILDQLDTKSRGYKSRILCRIIYFTAIEISEKLDIGKWLPRYLSNCQSINDLNSVIQKIGIDEIDNSFKKLIELAFNSFKDYEDSNVTMEKAKNSVTELAIQLNQHFITTENVAKQSNFHFEKYHRENFKRLRMYLDKAFLHLMEDRLEYSINLRNKIIFHCISQNNFHDYATLVFRPMDFLIEKEAA